MPAVTLFKRPKVKTRVQKYVAGTNQPFIRLAPGSEGECVIPSLLPDLGYLVTSERQCGVDR